MLLKPVFLSFADGEDSSASRLAEDLRAHHIAVVQPGASDGPSHLSNCRAVIVLATDASSKSPQVLDEMKSAKALGLPVVPIYLGDVDRESPLARQLDLSTTLGMEVPEAQRLAELRARLARPQWRFPSLRISRTRAAWMMAAAFVAVMAGAVSLRPHPTPVSVAVDGVVELQGVGQVLLPGQVGDGRLNHRLVSVQPESPSALLMTIASMTRHGETTALRTKLLDGSEPAETQLRDFVVVIVEEFGSGPWDLRLGLAVRTSGAQTATSPASQWSKYTIGFRAVPGLKYPVGVPDSAEQGWHATAIREKDGARVSVFLDPDQRRWRVIDQEPVAVKRYAGFLASRSDGTSRNERFLRSAAALLPPRCYPVRLGTFEALVRPNAHTIPIADVADLTAAFSRGPLLRNPAPDNHDVKHQYYVPPYLRNKCAVSFDPTLTNTDDLPIIGISYLEAVAYAAWLNDAAPAGWQIGGVDPSFAGAGSRDGSPTSPSCVVRLARHPDGLGRFGLYWFGNGDLYEFGEGDIEANEVPLLGTAHGLPSPGTIPVTQRRPDCTFRLQTSIFVEE